jgi:transketolase
VKAKVLSIHALRPFDIDTLLRAAREAGGIVTLEEHSISGGLGNAASDVLVTTRINAWVLPLGLASLPLTKVGSQAYLRKRAGLSPVQIVRIVEDQLSQSSQIPSHKRADLNCESRI